MNALIKTATLVSAIIIIILTLPFTARADTDGSEIQVTDRPDQFILQLGPQWAATESELKTDAGGFPVPVVVDPSGILKMDLGGSSNYILSRIAPPAAEQTPEPAPETPGPAPLPPDIPDVPQPEPEPASSGIPIAHLAIFLFGVAAAAGGLAALFYFKRRRRSNDYDYDYDDDY
jgi:hypothetical protein